MESENINIYRLKVKSYVSGNEICLLFICSIVYVSPGLWNVIAHEIPNLYSCPFTLCSNTLCKVCIDSHSFLLLSCITMKTAQWKN